MFSKMFAKKEKYSVLCVGSVSKDVFFPTNEGKIWETPEDLTAQRKIVFELGAKYQIDDIYEAPGGVAANVAQGLSRLGINVAVHSNIGDDSVGEWIKKELKREGVEIAFLETEKNSNSDLSAIIVDRDSGERVIFFNRDSNEKLKVDAGKFPLAEWVFISALNGEWKKNLDKILDWAQMEKVKIAFNPGQRNIQDDPEKIKAVLRRADLIFLNKDEAIGIIERETKTKEEREKLNEEFFLLKNIQNFHSSSLAVLTDGRRGGWAFNGKSFWRVDASADSPIETTGAGDAFTSGFFASYLKGKDVQECLRWGATNGGNVVRFYGAKEGLLKTTTIEKESKKIKVEKIK